MLDSQRLQIRISEIRSRLNEISGLEGDDFTEEIRQESDTLTTEFREAEAKYRAAVVLEDEETLEGAPLDSESAEIRSLLGRAELRKYVNAAISNRSLDGAEGELVSALIGENHGLPGTPLPYAVLAGPVESRADTSTALPVTGVETVEQDYVARVFARGSSDFLGIRFDTVSRGEASYFVMGAGLNPEHKAAGAIKDAEAASINGKVLEPHRVSAAYTFRQADLLRSPNLEAALRQDLANALRSAVDDAVINSATDGPGGLLAGLTEPNAPGGVNSSFSSAISLVAAEVDGLFSRNLRECRLLTGEASYQAIAGSFATGAAISASDYLLERAGGLMASSLIPAPVSDIQAALLAKTGAEGPNAIAAVWEGANLEIIRDPYTRSSRAEIRLQINGFWDLALMRLPGFSYLKFQLA